MRSRLLPSFLLVSLVILCLALQIGVKQIAFATIWANCAIGFVFLGMLVILPPWRCFRNRGLNSSAAAPLLAGGRSDVPDASAPLREALDRETVSSPVHMQVIDRDHRKAGVGNRLDYLDNLKIFLTVLVIFHHTLLGLASYNYWYLSIGFICTGFPYCPYDVDAGSLQGWIAPALQTFNQSFFMSLFFFISGLFTPTSFDKKGTHKFLIDKFKRLGFGFALYSLVLGPTLNMARDAVFAYNPSCGGAGSAPLPPFYISCPGNSLEYTVDPGPTWFLAWLLLFNAAYCCIGGPAISLGRPRLCWMVAAGLLGGMLQYVLSHRFEMTSFALMPITFGSLPADMIFFTSGVVARRNGWLDGDSSLPRGEVIIATAASVCYFAALFVFWKFVPGTKLYESSAVWFALFTLAGGFAVCVSYSLIAWFQRALNFTSGVSRFLARGAYTAYIVHPWAVVVMTYSWAIIIDAAYPDVKVFESFFPTFYLQNVSIAVFPEGMRWLGLAYVTIVGNALMWPLSSWLASRPGLDQVL